MSAVNSWALEFVGGPLDGRKDIATPTGWTDFIHAAIPRVHMTVGPINEPSASDFLTINHWYKRGAMGFEYTRPEGTNRIEWEVWFYHGAS